ncbi:MAG: peptidylprolyl isomerase [Nitrospiraceae bacterium]|nr:peptidylprolyl isomerase [Nitrospiraceae bacterium]|tara:strand:+ start:243 stop:818 length:576 start_codon:yes stop_codon:yes gene_type:complete
MKVGPKTVVAMDYAVLLDSGEVGESTYGKSPVQFIYGDQTVVPGLYKAIAGLTKGDRRSFKIDPTEGYGVYEASEVRKVPRAGLPPELTPEVNMALQVKDPTGTYRLVTIKEVEDETLTVDFNHPYAGHTLTFDVLIRDVREVTDEELEQGLTSQVEEGEDDLSAYSGPGGNIADNIMEDDEPPDYPEAFN